MIYEEVMEKAVENHIKMINDLISKSIKKYCEINRIDFESFKKTPKLNREARPNYESFFHHGVEIFRMEKTRKDFNNGGCSGIVTTYSIREFF